MATTPGLQNPGDITLKMLVVEGKLYRDTETFGQMDPFMVIEYNNTKYKTPVHQDGGKTPVWNHELLIPLRSMEDSIKMTCFDEDVIMDSCVGLQTYTVSTIANEESPTDNWFPLYYKGKKAADIHLINTIEVTEERFPLINLKDIESGNNKWDSGFKGAQGGSPSALPMIAPSRN